MLSIARVACILLSLLVVLPSANANAVTVAVLQASAQSSASSRLQSISQLATQAVQSHGAKVLVLPEKWAADRSEISGYLQLTRNLDLALTFTYTDGNQSAVALVENGSVLLEQRKPSSSVPTQSGPGQVVTLSTGLRVGLLVGTDRWFPEVSRGLMVAGADALLAPSSGTITDMDNRVLGSRSMTHVTAIATASYAEDGKSSIFSYCGPMDSKQHTAWVSTMIGSKAQSPDGCVTQSILGSGEEIISMPIDLTALASLRMLNTIQG